MSSTEQALYDVCKVDETERAATFVVMEWNED